MMWSSAPSWPRRVPSPHDFCANGSPEAALAANFGDV